MVLANFGMVNEIFSKIIESIEKKRLNKKADIDKSKFIEIKKQQNNKKIAFIDGGQAELLKAADFSLQFIRTAALIFQNNKKIDSVINEFFVLTYADKEEYKTEMFPLKGEAIDNITINPLDPTIKQGNERAPVSKIGNMARRFAELELAKTISDRADIIVLDGSLKCMVKGEDRYMQSLFEKANNTIISALAKTSEILSEDGTCIISQLADQEGTWYYNLEDDVIVKLNKHSHHVFEFSIKQKDKTKEVLEILADNSNDSVFPGYPYGLIQADKVARVSNEEKNYLLTLIMANAGKKWNKLETSLNVLNAHEILDNIG